MEPTDKWTFYLDDAEQACVEQFDTKEEALAAGMEAARLDDADTITVGIINEFYPWASNHVDELLEGLQDDAAEEASEYADTWLDYIDPDDKARLEHYLDAAFLRWLDEYPQYKPNFFTVSDTVTYDKEGEPLD